MKRIFSFLNGFFFGGIVGVSVALLLTPSSGEDLRSDIQTRYIEVRDEVQNAADARRVELEKQLENLRKPASPAG